MSRALDEALARLERACADFGAARPPSPPQGHEGITAATGQAIERLAGAESEAKNVWNDPKTLRDGTVGLTPISEQREVPVDPIVGGRATAPVPPVPTHEHAQILRLRSVLNRIGNGISGLFRRS